MAYKLTYTAQLIGPAGNTYTFGGSQQINSANPQPADLTTACIAMETDILNQMTNGTANDPSFTVQSTDATTQD